MAAPVVWASFGFEATRMELKVRDFAGGHAFDVGMRERVAPVKLFRDGECAPVRAPPGKQAE